MFKSSSTSSNSYVALPGDFSLLERLADGTFRCTLKDQTVYIFNTQNKLSQVHDRNGNETQYIYDAAGLLTKLVDPVGLETTFTYTGNRVSTIIDPASWSHYPDGV